MSVNGTNDLDQLQPEEPASETAGATRFDVLQYPSIDEVTRLTSPETLPKVSKIGLEH